MKKSDVITVEDVEKYYSTCRSIKFKNYTPENIEDCIWKLIGHSLKNDNETCGIRNGFHCKKCKMRSLDDLINICKYYYPTLSVKDILIKIYENSHLKHKYSNYISKLSYCSIIRKSNFWHEPFEDIDIEKNTETIKNTLIRDSGFINCNLQFKHITD